MIPPNPPYFTGGLLIWVLTFKWTFSSMGRSNLINAKIQKGDLLYTHTDTHTHSHTVMCISLYICHLHERRPPGDLAPIKTSRCSPIHRRLPASEPQPLPTLLSSSMAAGSGEHTIQQLHRDMWLQTETSTQRYEQNAFHGSHGSINWDKDPAILQ